MHLVLFYRLDSSSYPNEALEAKHILVSEPREFDKNIFHNEDYSYSNYSFLKIYLTCTTCTIFVSTASETDLTFASICFCFIMSVMFASRSVPVTPARLSWLLNPWFCLRKEWICSILSLTSSILSFGVEYACPALIFHTQSSVVLTPYVGNKNCDPFLCVWRFIWARTQGAFSSALNMRHSHETRSMRCLGRVLKYDCSTGPFWKYDCRAGCQSPNHTSPDLYDLGQRYVFLGYQI